MRLCQIPFVERRAHDRGDYISDGRIWFMGGRRPGPVDALGARADSRDREATVEHLLGIDSRIIPATEARSGVAHQNIRLF